MSETRKLGAILCSDVVGYSRLGGADEDRIFGTAAAAAQRHDRSHYFRARGLAPWRYDQREDFARPRFGCVTYGGVSGHCADCHAAIN
jgi:hypothetical protein